MSSHNFILNEPIKRLDVYLTNQLNLSRTKVSYLILNGHVKVNGTVVLKNNLPIKANNKIEVNYDPSIFNTQKEAIVPTSMELDIVYEDEYLAVVNKQKDLIIHPTTHGEKNTLVNGLLHHFLNNEKYPKAEKVFMVHRLDRDTTGLVIAAKNYEVLQKLQQQLQVREVKRFYLAIVNFPFNELMGTIDAPLGHMGDDNLKFCVVNAKNPKRAITKFYVLDQNAKHALIKCELLTGRTHQIRAHLEFINHPILGDIMYGLKGELKDPYKQYLHAYQLEFNHPITKKKIFLEAPLDQTFQDKLHELNLTIFKSLENLVNEKI
ncbi:RluA family pseudouridine synthase [[Mycoplasma] testudinis]|uniref:RluA family pseudouridine synthase n=1 Tax=[Mycoplasma] testudinis TaxID=33924 RepID=UPI00048665F1|nr:RluA family pseudouridine synthase [[Mycoplasma] testudinis]